jgi:ribosomal protein L21
MYAVIQTGGKQYRVEPGKTVLVEKLAGDAGAKIVFNEVLLVSSGDGGSVTVGKPLVAGAKVTAEIVDKVVTDNPKQAEGFAAGKDGLFGFFVGQVMKATQGRANPVITSDLLHKRLGR